MAKLSDFVQWQTHSAEPIPIGEATLTAQSQALQIRWPNGGMVWNRPVAVLVERDGEIERHPVIDLYRLVQLGLLALSVSFIFLTSLSFLRGRRKHG